MFLFLFGSKQGTSIGSQGRGGLFPMRDFAKGFYNTSQWQKVRNSYIKYKGGLCEKCLERGLISAGEIVHHKIFLTPENISNPNISLSFDNLELLCRQCHADIHEGQAKRWRVENGKVESVW